jgi:Tfp pilus assembly protein FimT
MTLIELIVVMSLLTIVLSLSLPLLSRFVRGRALQEEGRRILALTRYARNEAISRGVPMELWIDEESGEYGLQAVAGFEDEEKKAPLEYVLRETLTLDVESTGTERGRGTSASANRRQSTSTRSQGSSLTGRQFGSLSDRKVGTLSGKRSSSGSEEEALTYGETTGIIFQPDGSIDPASAPRLVLRDTERAEQLVIERTENGLAYTITEIRNEEQSANAARNSRRD